MPDSLSKGKKYFWAVLLIVFFAGFLLFSPGIQAQGRKGYYRYPAIHGDLVVFVSEGDLWSVGINGGLARRLTTHHGEESHPSISPDGKILAFSAQYEGPTEVYTMPVEGGLPKRKTFAGQTSTVVGWTPTGKIIYATRKYSTLPNTQLVVLDPASNEESLLPLAQAAEGCFTPDEKLLIFTRLPFQGSYTKRYKGGTVQNLWKFDLANRSEAEPLTADYPGTSKNPMLWKNKIYFVSDRSGTMNLWSMNLDGSGLKQLTFHDGFDVSSPSLHDGRIVYQLVADLRIYDIDRDKDYPLEIIIPSDFDQMREKWIKNPVDYLSSSHISPNGDRLVFVSRGNVFVAPVGDGRWVRIGYKEGIRHRSARFFPDGKNLMLLNDQTGEWEFYRAPANGLGKIEQLTTGAKVIRFDGIPSPDGRWLAFTDKNYQLWLADLKAKKLTRVAVSQNDMFQDLTWSPDSRFLAFVEAADNQFLQIKILEIATGKITAVTSDRVDCYNPAWSPDGKWLYFLSDRYFRSVVGSPWGPRQPEPYFDRTTKIYALGLSGKDVFPWMPENELLAQAKETDKSEESTTSSPSSAKSSRAIRASSGKKQDSKEACVEINYQGLQDRVFEVPLPPSVYSSLTVGEKALFFIDRESRAAGRPKLKAVTITNRRPKVETLLDGVRQFELSASGNKIMVQKGSEFYVIDAMPRKPASLADHMIDLSQWQFSIDPRSEWRQMFIDAWRMERDYFYDRNLHGVDYEGLLKRHLPYLERVSDRQELNDLIAHLVGELSALHTFVRGGDIRRPPDNVLPGSLGARLVKDEDAGGWRIAHIYRTDPEYPEKFSPLARPGVKIKEGDVIVAINGRSTLSVDHPSLLLRNAAGTQVLLELINSKGQKYKEIIYPITISAEVDLRYSEWEYTRRLKVEQETSGEVGYVHLRAMGGNNYTEWVKNFYPVFNRKGLIIDVRHNRGGNIDSWILEKLLRKAWFYWQPRVGNPYWNMQYAFRGHMVVLCNEFTASDGEAFTEGFRRLGLGKVIGVRTWGGEIWLTSSNRLVDRGIATAAEFGVYGPEREWLIEGHGVEPDIVVDNLPYETFQGEDAQLERAIAFLKELIEKEPVEIPPHPPYPVKKVKK